MKEQFIQVRVDEKLKHDATAVLEAIGIDMATGIRLFLKKVVLEKGLPFDLKIPEETHELIPAKPCLTVSQDEYIDCLMRVPTGKLTRMEDIRAYIAKKHGVEKVEFEWKPLGLKAFDIPFWREVSTRGFLIENMFCSKEQQRQKLIEEGFEIVSGGPRGNSLIVKDYRDYLVDYHSLVY